ncbi:MAG TPA: malonic semialdehyde reductase [Caulobacter sp.]|nr:malonic semialdehyde reductase [Caulobacter sp.]
MSDRLPDASLDQVFRTARTRNGWTPDKVPEALIREIYDLAKMGPTSGNCLPGRFLFLTSDAAKARLAPFMSSTNRAKTLAAPVNVIMAYDMAFADRLPELFPHNPGAKDWFTPNPALTRETAFRNGSLQAAYLMLAARSLGLDCGPMSGVKLDGVNAEFFAGTTWEANFVCNIGYGTDEGLFPRNPRLPFEEACGIL